MRTLDFSLNDTKNGGKITAFSYSHGLNELCGSWRASIAGGNFKAGNSISFSNVLTDGIIFKALKDGSGLWHIDGYDAGIKLMRSTPEISDLPEGNAKTVLQYIAGFCGITLVMTGNGLSGFNVRSIVSGSTCAEAVLELAMFSGCIAFIGNDGKLYVKPPATKAAPTLSNIIDDTGSDFDLDGYATQVSVILSRRSEDTEDNSSGGGNVYYTGKTPSTTPTRNTYTGSFSNGSYKFVILEPFGVTESAETTITENAITIHSVETHNFTYKHKIIWRGNQEYVLFAFFENASSLTKTTTGTYSTQNSGNLSFSETTTETMSRSLSVFDAVGVPDDWAGQIDMVDSETVTRSTVREGGKAVTADMPPYSPPFDTQITRKFTRGLRGKNLLCSETEKHYEARQVGSISPVKVNGVNVPHFLLNSNLAIQSHSTPQWVLVNTYRTYYEQYNEDGDCVISTRSEYSDDGAQWLAQNALSDTGDNDLNDYQKAYAKFSQHSHGLEVSIGQSIISQPWHFLELQGRMKNKSGDDENGTVLGNLSDWYNNGEFLPLDTCPFYNSSANSCNIYKLASYPIHGQGCYMKRGNFNWKDCERSKAALSLARQQEASQLNAPIIGTASLSSTPAHSPTVGYKREIYVDEIISDEVAQSIADNIAANILAVKGTKGLRKTVTVPYSPSILPDGAIVEVAHDWENLTSSVTYRDTGNIPDFLVPQSVSGIADFVAARGASRLSVPQYGVVVSVSEGKAVVKVGNNSVNCTTKLKNLGVHDNVLVSFPSGNKLRGQVISRL